MRCLLASVLSIAAALPVLAADGAPAPTAPAADNSGINERDRADAAKTPEDQGDVALLAAVRRAITKDDAISINGRNVKIAAVGGVVTLRGPVKDAAEKAKIAALVAKVDGVTSVDNQLETTAP